MDSDTMKRAKELAVMLPVHVTRLANRPLGLSLMDWGEISSDIIDAANLLALLSEPEAPEAEWLREGERLLAEFKQQADFLRKAEEAGAELQIDYEAEFDARNNVCGWLLAHAHDILSAARRDAHARRKALGDLIAMDADLYNLPPPPKESSDD